MKILHWELSEKLSAYWTEVEQAIDKPIKVGYTSELGPSYANFRAAASINPGEDYASLRIKKDLVLPTKAFEAQVAHELAHLVQNASGIWFIEDKGSTELTGHFANFLGDPAANIIVEKRGLYCPSYLIDECRGVYFSLMSSDLSDLNDVRTKTLTLMTVRLLLQQLPDNYNKTIPGLIQSKSRPFYEMVYRIINYIHQWDMCDYLQHNHCLSWVREQLNLENEITFIDDNPLRYVTQKEVDLVLSVRTDK